MEPDTLNAYGKSKTMAEKAAWEYVKELPGTFFSDFRWFSSQNNTKNLDPSYKIIL